jgi:uncharacterized protein YecE (DUF72 family)
LIHIGTSGWHYAHWRGNFYPCELPSSGFLPYYAQRFETVEINNSFYRLPSEETFREWRHAVPEGFCFAVKGSRFITHMKKLLEPEHALDNLLARAVVLGEKLGPVLFQLPPRWRFNPERLDAFLSALPAFHRYVFEFREPSWYHPEAYAILRRHRAALCLHDMAGQSPQELTADWTYLRFHGAEGRYHGGYSRETLDRWAKTLSEWARRGLDVYAYFNNDAFGQAIVDARTLVGLSVARAPSAVCLPASTASPPPRYGAAPPPPRRD